VAVFAFATIFGLGACMVSQVSQLANDLPRYHLEPFESSLKVLRYAMPHRSMTPRLFLAEVWPWAAAALSQAIAAL